MTGVRSESAKLAPPMMPSAPHLPTVTAPDSWKPLSAAGKVWMMGYEVVEGGDRVEITISLAGGSLADNVNRWRGQVGLPVASEDLILAESAKIEVDGAPALYVDLVNKDLNRRILGVICPKPDGSWFFKMTGSPELAGKQKSAFESFVRTARFNAGP
jgi:hypothetical protein